MRELIGIAVLIAGIFGGRDIMSAAEELIGNKIPVQNKNPNNFICLPFKKPPIQNLVT